MIRKIDKLGRITIPAEMRKQLGLEIDDDVNIQVIDNQLVVTNINKFNVKLYVLDKLNELDEDDYKLGTNPVLDVEYLTKRQIYNDLKQKMK